MGLLRGTQVAKLRNGVMWSSWSTWMPTNPAFSSSPIVTPPALASPSEGAPFSLVLFSKEITPISNTSLHERKCCLPWKFVRNPYTTKCLWILKRESHASTNFCSEDARYLHDLRFKWDDDSWGYWAPSSRFRAHKFYCEVQALIWFLNFNSGTKSLQGHGMSALSPGNALPQMDPAARTIDKTRRHSQWSQLVMATNAKEWALELPETQITIPKATWLAWTQPNATRILLVWNGTNHWLIGRTQHTHLCLRHSWVLLH